MPAVSLVVIDISWKRLVFGCLIAALLTGCATSTPETPSPDPASSPALPTSTPGPRSCDEVEGECMMIIWDGENCVYEGPSTLKPGPVTFLFINESDWWAYMNLARHTGDETIQDMIEYIGEEPSSEHSPPWVNDLPGVWERTRSGRSHTWEGVLEPGIHTMVCSNSRDGIWFGGGFTVEE